MAKGLIEGQDYVISKWREYNNYHCTKCQFKTIWMRMMIDHYVKGKHAWAFPIPPGDKPKTDKYGDPIY